MNEGVKRPQEFSQPILKPIKMQIQQGKSLVGRNSIQ